jgi:hypothetical protein
MSEYQRRQGIGRRTLNWIVTTVRENPLATAAVAAVTALTLAQGAHMVGSNPNQLAATSNPDQARIHQMEANGMPQSDEAVRLDEEFPADHVQTKDVVISSDAEILIAPTDSADRVNNAAIIINGEKFVNKKRVMLTNGLEINDASGRYIVLMNVIDGGQQTILYVKEAAVSHPFGDSSLPVKKDSNGGYEAANGSIPASAMEIFTAPTTSPLDATPLP